MIFMSLSGCSFMYQNEDFFIHTILDGGDKKINKFMMMTVCCSLNGKNLNNIISMASIR